MDNNLLIAGIDPGTTTGYAILDIDGNLIKTRSSKSLSLNSLISEIIEFGNVIIVGTDKAKIPSLVETFSIKNGAVLVYPDEDLKVRDKKKLIYGYKVRDEHEADALASAIFAHKEYEKLLKKINDYVKREGKEALRDKLINFVITNKISIRHAIDIIEQPEQEEVKIIKNVTEEKKLSKSDFIGLYNKLKRSQKEIHFLKKQNNNMTKENKKIYDKYKYIARKIEHLKSDERSEKLINHKEKRIKYFDNEVKSKEKEIDLLRGRIEDLNSVLSNLNENYLLKKLHNLGSSEFENKKGFLKIEEGDILLVDDVNVFNNRVVEQIKKKVRVIVYKKGLNRITNNLPFAFLNHNGLGIKEIKHFGLVNKKIIDNELKKIDVFGKVISEYKEERTKDLYS